MIVFKAILYILLYGFIAILVGGMIKYLNEKYNRYMAEDAILLAIITSMPISLKTGNTARNAEQNLYLRIVRKKEKIRKHKSLVKFARTIMERNKQPLLYFSAKLRKEKLNMSTFKIYFSDLNEDAQKRLLEAVGVNEAKDMNWDMDILPIALYDYEEEK